MCAYSGRELHTNVTLFIEAHEIMGLSIHISETPSAKLGRSLRPLTLLLHGELFKNVYHFLCHGSNLSRNKHIDEQMRHRMSSASAAFGSLREQIFENPTIRTNIK